MTRLRVWVTRDEKPDGPLSAALRAAGLTPVLEPVIARHVVDGAAKEIAGLEPDDWLVLTSAYAVEALPVVAARVAVVGEATGDAARAKGFRVEFVSSVHGAAGLFAELRKRIDRGRVWYPRSSLATLPEAWADVEVISPVLYETCLRAFDRGVIDDIDFIAVASPSAVHAIGRIDVPYASIGPTTSAALREIGVEAWVEAPRRTFQSLANEISRHRDA